MLLFFFYILEAKIFFFMRGDLIKVHKANYEDNYLRFRPNNKGEELYYWNDRQVNNSNNATWLEL